MSLNSRPLSYALGAEIIGIDLRKPLNNSDFGEVHTAFLKHCLLLFRGQHLTRKQQITLSRRFGEVDMVEDYPRIGMRVPDYPEILLNKPSHSDKPADYFGNIWHSDLSYMLAPPMATLLRAVEVPEVGGDTMFASMYLAFEALSDGMKKLIEGLYGVNIRVNKKRFDDSSTKRVEETTQLDPPVAQPLVRLHPETGRKALYVNNRVKQLVGMTPEESGPLIQFLCKHAERPQFVYRHQWRKDDLLIWDNRCLMHLALGDYDNTQSRHMERTTVRGTLSGYEYGGSMLQ